MKKRMMAALALAALLAGGATRIVQDQCGPFTDVTPVLCPYVLEMYYLGITAGTSATTFSPDTPMTRGQAAVFVSKGLDQALARSSRRAALGQWRTPEAPQSLGLTTLTGVPFFCASDGADIWVSDFTQNTVSRVRASDGKLLETWTGAPNAAGVLVALSRVFVTGPGVLYMIDPTQPAEAVTTVASNLGGGPNGIAFDGARIWTANQGGSVSIITPGPTLPWSVTTVTTGFMWPFGALFDGSNVWVTDQTANSLLRLDSSGAVIQTVSVPRGPLVPVFDGLNIWVPSEIEASVVVVRASTGSILATLTGNGLGTAIAAAFDGQRILVTSNEGTVSLWKAADFSPLGFVSTGLNTVPRCPCSDGINVWIPLGGSSQIARF